MKCKSYVYKNECVKVSLTFHRILVLVFLFVYISLRRKSMYFKQVNPFRTQVDYIYNVNLRFFWKNCYANSGYYSSYIYQFFEYSNCKWQMQDHMPVSNWSLEWPLFHSSQACAWASPIRAPACRQLFVHSRDTTSICSGGIENLNDFFFSLMQIKFEYLFVVLLCKFQQFMWFVLGL